MIFDTDLTGIQAKNIAIQIIQVLYVAIYQIVRKN